MEGTPERLRIDIRISLVIRLLEAYSLRKMAQPIPKGTDKTAVITVTINVPTIAGKIPPSVIPFLGIVVRNSQEIFPAPLLTRSKIIINNIKPTRPIDALKKRKPSFSLN